MGNPLPCFDTNQIPLHVQNSTLCLEVPLKRPIYRTTAAYGHFGRTGDAFTWEHTDHAEALRAASER